VGITTSGDDGTLSGTVSHHELFAVVPPFRPESPFCLALCKTWMDQ
jgi:hypothetical protein